ncbi:hypothetical protein HAZT_HAZT001622 [Hyalella azteca]|uniref:C-type lectin domain-containing protein n=1 Tax=Hyalella azteca TaxID=294128 RepID=A0A6A0GXU8_HYAAZ|nr:hypothetical protein HAZT_HAZT001622 [Hyalella azteca]
MPVPHITTSLVHICRGRFSAVQTSERFEWSDGRPALFTNWAPGEGATGATGALREEASRCVELSTQRPGAWAAKSCDEAKPFICKYENVTAPILDPAVTGGCLSKDWVDFGGSFCYLVNANDQFTWAKANSQGQEADECLIRGREAEFLWSDGTAFDFMHWAPEEPNSQSEKCVEMFSGKGEWNDISCDVLRGYICKTNKKPLSETTSLIAAAETSEHLSHRQDDIHLSSGSVVALVVVSLVVTAALGYVVYTYVNHLRVSRPTHRPAAITSFDNALYNPDALENSILESAENLDGRCHSVTLSLGRS